MECKGVGLGLLLDPDDGEVRVFISLHAEEEDSEPVGMIAMPLEKAGQVSAGLIARLLEANAIHQEIQGTPPSDRQAAVQRIMARMSSGHN